MKELKSILVVEDERIVAWDIREKLENLGYTVPALAHTAQEAIDACDKHRPDLVLMDIRLEGDMDGVETAEIVRLRNDMPVVYLTSYSDKDTLDRAKLTEPYGYLIKPFEERDLRTTLEIAFDKFQRDTVKQEFRRGDEDDNGIPATPSVSREIGERGTQPPDISSAPPEPPEPPERPLEKPDRN